MIEIYAVTYNGQPASTELKGVFGDDGGSIGRSHENRLALPDPARHVSRIQVRIRSDGARFWLANVSDANPVFVNDQEVPSHTERPLASGDEIRMGLYVLRVREATGAAFTYQSLPSERATARPLANAPPVGATAGSVDALLGAGGTGESPFADLLGGAALPPAPAPAPSSRGTSTPSHALDPLQQLRGMPASDPVVARPAAGPIPAPAPAAPAADVLAALGASGLAPGAGGADPFADLLGSTPQATRQAPLREPETPRPFAGGTIPDDFDPFATPAPTRNSDDPLKDLAKAPVDLGGMSDRASGSLVDFTLDGRSNPQDALRGGTPSLVDPLQAVDPMKLFGGAEDRLLADAPGEPAAGALPMRDDMPELGAFFAPPRSIEDPALPHQAAGAAGRPAPVSPTARTAHAPPQRGEPPATPIPTRPTVAPPAPPTPAPEVRGPRPTSPAPVPADRAAGAAPIGSAGQDALIAAFLEGAHAANVPIPGGLTPALMRQLGALVFQAVAGAMALIAARQITKREIGAEMTMIVASGNNPLKFLPTAEAAITQMIGPHMPGFMTPEAAMRNAFEDLSAHEIGVIAGTRAAFAEVLRRFDPEQLEERLGKGGMLDAVLPVARRGKLWSLYQERFHQIRSEAQDDFDSLFGEAFTKAYEDEVARQRSQRSPG